MENKFYQGATEALLWQAFKDGQEEAYSFMYEKYISVLYRYGHRICLDENLVQDCIQDLFVTLWCSRANLVYTDSIKYYLFRSLRREIVRKQKTRFAASSLDGMDKVFLLHEENSFEQQQLADEELKEQQAILNMALTTLSDRQREAVFLRFYENMDFKDIAAVMAITPRALYKLLYRAIDTLQASYKNSPKASFTYAIHQLTTPLLLLLEGIFPTLAYVSFYHVF